MATADEVKPQPAAAAAATAAKEPEGEKVPSKRPADSAAEASCSSSSSNKRQRNVASPSATLQPPKPREEMSEEELKATLKRQVEYYLSDSNLATDAFFHGKIKEAEQQGIGVRHCSSRLRLTRFQLLSAAS